MMSFTSRHLFKLEEALTNKLRAFEDFNVTQFQLELKLMLMYNTAIVHLMQICLSFVADVPPQEGL